MRKARFILGIISVLVLACPALSSSQVIYVMNASAPYSYVTGANPIPNTYWVGGSDDGYFDLPLGDFAFQFYGVPVTTLRISTNGYITFGTGGLEFLNRPIPSSLEPNALIAPFWTDLTLSFSGQVRWSISGTSPSRQLVVEWSEVPCYNFPAQTYSFEAILYESTNKIKFQYSNVTSGIPYSIGVENFDGTSGSQFSYNGTPPLSNEAAIEFIPKITTIFLDDFSTDKGWTGYETGAWQREPALAGGGENGNPDPATDHSASGDNYILGFAIGGDYPNNLVEKSIVSPPINCSGEDQVYLKFWRYLNVGSSYYDHAKVYVSNDGTNWTQFWENPVFDITDNQWIQVVFDISSIAANQGNVYIKFTMGPTNATGRYSGWNIDDLEVTSIYGGPMALYVPSGGVPNPNIDEIVIENGLGIKHFNLIPSDLSNHDLLIVSDDGACNLTTANYIKNFVQNGGGAIIMGGTPSLLAGNTVDLLSISDWFGAGLYGNDGGYGTVTVTNPFGTDLWVDDKVDYSTTDLAAAVYNLEPAATPVSKWSSDGTHSFFYRFGQGRVFYYAGNPGYPQDPDPIIAEKGLILFEAGLIWATGCTLPMTITQPESQTIPSGQTASMWVGASGTTPFSYQWYQGSSGDTSNPIPGAIADIYTTPSLTQTKTYWVRVTNSCGFVDSATAIITMADSCTAPNITSQPQSQTIQSGQTALMSVGASGTALSYQWYLGSSGDTSNPISSGATSSSYTTPALTQTTSYWVRMTNSCGSADSNTAIITVIPAAPPPAPTNVSASDGTYMDRVEVTWATSTGATSYTVYRATSNTNWAQKTALGTATETFFNDTTAVPKTTYYYWVKASNTYGTSGFSTSNAGSRSDGTPPAPTNVSASDGTYADNVLVTWTASPNATSYTVYRATSTSSWVTKTVLGTTTNTTFDDTTASVGITYYYWVKAFNTYGMSGFSGFDAGSR
jgi:hypothetical protein